MDVLHRFIRDLVANKAAHAKRQMDRIAEIEADGHRVVDGGQTTQYDDAGHSGFNVIDWRTKKVIAEGYGEFEDYDRLLADLGGDFWHIDAIDEEMLVVDVPVPDGLPESLAEAIRDWAEMASPEDLEVVERL